MRCTHIYMKGLFGMEFEYHENEMIDDNTDTNVDTHEYRVDNTLVNFCCTIDLPPNFEVVEDVTVPHRFLYTTDCLDIVIEAEEICYDTKCGPLKGTCNNARLIGCIPYLANIAVTSECGGAITGPLCNTTTDGSNIGYICCKGNICVNQIIGSSTEKINVPAVLNCDLVKLINFGVTGAQTIGICDQKIECAQRTVVGTIQLPTVTVSHTPCP